MAERASDPGLRLLGLLMAAVVVWLATFATATVVLNQEPDSVAVRAAMVGVAVLGFLPAIGMLARVIRTKDEFARRVHVIALAVAFGATAVIVFTADFLQRAGFVDDVPLTTIWMGMAAIWWLSMLVTAWYYR